MQTATHGESHSLSDNLKLPSAKMNLPMNKLKRTHINLLWTGGLDSTFRLCELSRNKVDVQCYYILDPTRKSAKYELRAMELILSLLRNHPETMAKIYDIKPIEFETIKPDKKIQDSHSFFVSWNKLGSQYDYLARFAKQNNIKLEVGLEGSARGKATNVLKEFGNLIKDSYTDDPEQWAEYYRIDPQKASPECVDIFENIRMPAHLFAIEKADEVDIMSKWGGYTNRLQAIRGFVTLQS